ncbi:MAG: mechanosensitive ion channel [Boseongicola sp.]|nr:mechanosensitive ion channel [Boseongicola sp.]
MIVEAGLSAAVFAGWFVAARLVDRWLARHGERRKAAPQRAFYIAKVFDFGLAVLAVLSLLLVWGIDHGSVFLFASSIIAVMSVSLFAQWSILSNVTASIVIFFTYRARLGDRVQVLDSNDSGIEGVIVDINLLQVVMRDDAGNVIYYPNNLFIQKPVMARPSTPREATSPLPEASPPPETGWA